jgi:hypothetical protein
MLHMKNANLNALKIRFRSRNPDAAVAPVDAHGVQAAVVPVDTHGLQAAVQAWLWSKPQLTAGPQISAVRLRGSAWYPRALGDGEVGEGSG